MENIVNKIKSYAKANGINEINFQSDVKIVKPSDESPPIISEDDNVIDL